MAVGLQVVRTGTPWTARVGGLLLLALLLGALLMAAHLFYASEQRAAQSSERIRRTYEVRVEVRNVFLHLVNADTGLRGYLLTGKPRWLEPYARGTNALPHTLARLDSLAEGNGAQSERLAQIRALVRERAALMDSLRARTAAGSQGAVPEALLARCQALGERISSALMATQIEEERTLMAEDAINSQQRDAMRGKVLGSLIGGVAAGMLAAYLFLSALRRPKVPAVVPAPTTTAP